MAEAQPQWKAFYTAESRYVCFTPEREPLERSRVRLVQRLWPGPVAAALDVGCGDGFLCSEWVRWRSARQVHGTDLVADRVARARQAVPSGHFSVQSAYALSFPDQRFDLVSLVETLEHMERPEQVLHEAARVTNRYVLITVPYREDIEANQCLCPYCLKRFHPAGHLHSFDEAALTALCALAGLTVRWLRVQSYLRVFDRHPILSRWPAGVVEWLQERARRAQLIQGTFLGVLAERAA